MDVQIHISLTSSLVGGEWPVSCHGRFTPGERSPGINSIGGWIGPIAGLGDLEKRKFLTLPGFELRPLRRPARSQSLHRLRYPGSIVAEYRTKIKSVRPIKPVWRKLAFRVWATSVYIVVFLKTTHTKFYLEKLSPQNIENIIGIITAISEKSPCCRV
jgi:hypothetical protein